MGHPTHLLTADEFARLPDDDSRYELVEGRVVRMSPPGARHGAIAVRLAVLLDQHVASRKMGVVLVESGFKLASKPDTVRGPEVAFVRLDRIPAAGLPSGFWHGPPDLAVEILSADDLHSEISEKVREYLARGVRLVWIVDPEQKTVTVHRATGAPLTVRSDGTLDGADVLPGFACEVGHIFT